MKVDYGGFSGSSSIVRNEDSSYTICGSAESANINNPVLLKINKQGALVWSTKLAYNTAFSSKLIKTNDKGYVTISSYYGRNNVSVLLTKFDKNGEACSESSISIPVIKNLSYGVLPFVVDSLDIISQLYIENGYVKPVTGGTTGDSLLCAFAINKQNVINNISAVMPDNRLTLKISTNPVINEVLNLIITNTKTNTLQLTITSLDGKTVLSQKLAASSITANKTINISSLASGMYIINVTNGKEKKTLKFIKQ
ncbi:MAG: T9SS type A sorting domain-containing protein [Panacibacter sp.]